jgi:hypothetical protein
MLLLFLFLFIFFLFQNNSSLFLSLSLSLSLFFFLSFLQIVFRVPTTQGQALYGSKYYSAGYYGSKHNVLSGNTNCDHLHDGIGFLPNHLALTVYIH